MNITGNGFRNVGDGITRSSKRRASIYGLAFVKVSLLELRQSPRMKMVLWFRATPQQSFSEINGMDRKGKVSKGRHLLLFVSAWFEVKNGGDWSWVSDPSRQRVLIDSTIETFPTQLVHTANGRLHGARKSVCRVRKEAPDAFSTTGKVWQNRIIRIAIGTIVLKASARGLF